MTEYRVALEVYNGPLDLLLFLIRREEVDIYDIPIARITEQYLKYVDVLKQLDPESVSEFLVLAATLMEIKSRTLLPRPPVEEAEEEIVDPRLELVRQLLEYKKYKDAARSLGHSARERSLQHARSPVPEHALPDELELEDVDIWDLVDAFRRVLEQIGRTGQVHEIDVDDTPMAFHAEDIVDSVDRAGGTQKFEEIFAGRTQPELIGLFIALLELMRQRRVRVSQDKPLGIILIHLLDRRPLDEPADEGDERIDGTEDGEDLDPSLDEAHAAAAAENEDLPAETAAEVNDAPESAPLSAHSSGDSSESYELVERRDDPD